MKILLGIAGIAFICWISVVPWHREHYPQYRNDSILQTWQKLGRPSVPVKRVRLAHQSQAGVANGVARSWSHLASRMGDLGISDTERDLIMDLQEESGVPSWVLFGIWTNESGRLSGGWREDSQSWMSARDAALDPDSRCRRERSDLCLEAWDALRSICAQTRRDGTQVCSPDQVWTSYTLAMGPMQQMPRPFIIGNDGDWKDHMVDYDGDGIIDPHSLPDAMASAATALRNGVIFYGSVQEAVQRYAGNTPHDHYAKLRQLTRPQWCAVEGYCNE